MTALLAVLLAQAPSTIFVAPFAVRGEAQPWAGVAVAESINDVIVQADTDNFLTLKQLDAVLRRRDLRPDDDKVPGLALELGRALGATDVVSGEITLAGDAWTIEAKRVNAIDGAVKKTAKVDGARALLPVIAQKLAHDLLGEETSAGPMTKDASALEHAARCEVELARQSLGAHSRMNLPADKLELAEKECNAALKLDPRFGLARAGVAVTLALHSKFAEARKHAQTARKDRFVPLATLAEAFAAHKMKDVAAWRTILQDAVDERAGFLHALGYLAEDRMEAGEDKEALDYFEKYLKRAPGHTWAMGKKAREMAKLKMFDEAIELSEKALALNPGDPELLIETASRYIDAGRDPRAEPLLKQAMEATPPRPLAALRLGYLYIRGHKLPQAREALQKCVEMATRVDEGRTRGIAHGDLARVSAKQNKYPEAVAELQKARAEGNNHLPCDEPELARWKERPEMKAVCVEAAAAAEDEKNDDDAVPIDL